MSNLSVDFQALSETGRAVIEEAEQYLAEIQTVYGRVEELKNVWQGADNQKYAATVEGYKAEIENLGRVIRSYGEFLVQTSQGIERVQSEISDNASKI